jgi:sugar lactone lactonase YvrE
MMRSRFFLSLCAVGFLTLPASSVSAQDSTQPEKAKATPVTTPYGIISTFAGDGWGGYYGDGGLATQAELHFPEGLAVDSAGNVYVADTDNEVIRKISASTGLISTYAGTLEGGYGGDNGPATSALLYNPFGVAVDTSGNLYIADSGNNVVRKVDSAGIITTFAGNGYGAGPERECGFSGDNGPADKAELCYPAGVAVDAAGDVYIADSGNYAVRKVAAGTGVITTVAGIGGEFAYGPIQSGLPATSVYLEYPLGIALDHSGNLYIAQFSACVVSEVNAKTGIINTIAGKPENSNYPNCSPSEEGVLAIDSPLEYPGAVAVDAAGNIYIAESENDLVHEVNAQTGIITTVAGKASAELQGETQVYYGIAGYSGDGGVATYAKLFYPSGVATDASGNLYIADEDNNAIRKVTATFAATTAAPVLTPPAPGSGIGFGSSQQVALSDTTPGATIYYTTNGDTPTTSSERYTDPITLTHSATVIAFATLAGKPNSYAAEGNYYQLAPPKISPDGGRFSTPQSVTITEPGIPASIVYTTDGSNPATSMTRQDYYEPITVSTSVTVKAAATLGGTYGSVATAVFAIPSAPVAVTGGATRVTTTTATLNGTVNPGDLATKYWFAYGTQCNNLTSITPQVTLAASGSIKSVSANISHLIKSNQYCFQVFASNSKGASSGDISNFTTAN